jgi:pimeloyl-ACP methyl ester carboxylesterase
MARTRILLVPTVTELEWRIKPRLEEWAEVASYDAPGVGGEPATEQTPEAFAERGLAELDRRGWDRCVLAGDEFGIAVAVRVAAARPEAVEALALGHACLSFASSGDRAPINGEVEAAMRRVAETDYRTYVHALTQATQHAYDEEFARAYVERVPQDVARGFWQSDLLVGEKEVMEERVRSVGAPLLFAEHRGCLLFTREGFEDAVAAFPDAETTSMELKPSTSPEFAETLRGFCTRLAAGGPYHSRPARTRPRRA